jgi:hypothetical protein
MMTAVVPPAVVVAAAIPVAAPPLAVADQFNAVLLIAGYRHRADRCRLRRGEARG